MKDFELTYHRFSERSILVQWPHRISKNILNDVLIFKNHLLKSNIKQVLQVNNAYNSILVIYKCTIDVVYDEVFALKALYFSRANAKNHVFRLWRIPVCYDDKFGIDLDEMSIEMKLSKSEIIKRHSEVFYTVFFIGFLPGFLYLGGLDKQLFFPRKKSPRLQIEKGAVAIGNQQTGIYPNVSPAGWNIIGNSPLEFFNNEPNLPCFAKAGDTIQFIPVSIEVHNEILKAVQNGTYSIESEVVYG
ncbi:5-oxoprolinase subunit PxpB [Psychroserpens ponticola]|uniref:5-oxoprolinase subunit PxpB n=1 Tax=Psychroserpens ponticola TaxID=2932268 RepID=A0ABY7RUB2_9FLAO|nr:5-oxoprolinase subunit PxpB [Psychroserpens ponticola]WCO00418.1 5-oxoprolinase subunit PxpB [Psychroserpens ponticola]